MVKLKNVLEDLAVSAFVPGSIAYNIIKSDRKANSKKSGSNLMERLNFGTKGLASVGLDLFSYSLYFPIAESALRLNFGFGEYVGIEPYIENPLLTGFLVAGTRVLANSFPKYFLRSARRP